MTFEFFYFLWSDFHICSLFIAIRRDILQLYYCSASCVVFRSKGRRLLGKTSALRCGFRASHGTRKWLAFIFCEERHRGISWDGKTKRVTGDERVKTVDESASVVSGGGYDMETHTKGLFSRDVAVTFFLMRMLRKVVRVRLCILGSAYRPVSKSRNTLGRLLCFHFLNLCHHFWTS